MNVKGTYLRNKRRSKTMNRKMTINWQLSTNEPKKQRQKLSKLEHENGYHMEGFQWGGRGEEWDGGMYKE